MEWRRKAAWGTPSRTFAVVHQRVLEPFEAKIAPQGKARRAGVFVHGFNVNFQEALFNLAQISNDAELDGAPVLFAWPSAASATAYVADKDAVTASRDGLADVLSMVTRGAGTGNTISLRTAWERG